jgi:hypothetical protein
MADFVHLNFVTCFRKIIAKTETAQPVYFLYFTKAHGFVVILSVHKQKYDFHSL